MYAFNWDSTTRSRTFETKGRFISSDGFLSSGVTAADFIESGMTPDCREELMKSVMRGAMLSDRHKDTEFRVAGWQGDNRGL